MDFGAILDRWEKSGKSGGTGEAWASGIANVPARSPGVYGTDGGDRENPQERRRRLRNKKPDAQIDIHGKTGDEARVALDSFFGSSRERGLEKVLVIHGKGNHSTGEAVLKRVVMEFVERCPFAGESGRGKAVEGGEGVTWVLLKETAAGNVRKAGP